MAKRQSKADVILSEARERVESALSKVQDAESKLDRAKAIWTIQTETYYALERQLAPKPRKKAAAPAKKEPTAPKGAMCNVCANEEDHPDHDTTYLSSHPFAFGVATAAKKSSRKGAATNSSASTGANTDSALDVVHGAVGEI